MRQLKNFQLDTNRDKLYPNVACYQMDLGNAVQQAIDAGLVEGEMKELPSWAKFVAHPVKAKGFFINILQSIFQGKGNLDELNVELQTEECPKRRVAMIFMPDNTRKDKLVIIAKIAQQALPNFEVIELSGNTTTQKKAQQKVKEIMESNPNKSILILAAKMAQRSFSNGKIDELYLAYDRGENGATIQKMSRALTPDSEDKVGKIFSLSFDANRDDKFDALLVQTALNQVKRNPNSTDIREELARILRTVDIFNCTEEGAIPIKVDTFIEQALSRKSISRVMGKIADIDSLPDNIINALANGDIDYLKNERIKATSSGKTKETVKKGGSGSKDRKPVTDKTREQVRQMITTIIENSDIIIQGTGTQNIREALNMIKEWNGESIIQDEFGISFDIVKYIFDSQIIKQEWVNLLYKV
jgi:hypothetical protein